MRIISPKEEYFFVEDRRNGSPCMRPNAIMTGTAARSTSLYRSTFSCTRRRIIASFCRSISGQAKAATSRSMAETIGSLPLRRISAKKKCFWQEQGAYRYGRTPITEGDPTRTFAFERSTFRPGSGSSRRWCCRRKKPRGRLRGSCGSTAADTSSA